MTERELTSEELADLVVLHDAWQRFVVHFVKEGVTEQDAVESMLTVALANKLRLEGSDRTVASLAFIVRGLVEERATSH